MRPMHWIFVAIMLLGVALLRNPVAADDGEEAPEGEDTAETEGPVDAVETYKAAVVEFQFNVEGATPAERIAARLQRIREHINGLPDGVDIVVFPEGAFVESTTFALTDVPRPDDRIVPCENETFDELSAMRLLSESAKAKSTYVVVNAAVRQTCDVTKKNPNPGECVYNTNIVFDRSGTVISTYRKFNVYVEPGINSTAEADLSTFSTDFGVVFGHTICFDIMYDEPAMQLIRDGIRHIIHPTWWYSELPSLTAVQTHQGWSQANGVNLLAAGISRVAHGSTGSGLYSSGSGALQATFASGKDVVLIADLPKVPADPTTTAEVTADVAQLVADLNRPAAVRVPMIRAPLNAYAWRSVNVSVRPVEYELCSGEFCCSFRHRLVDAEHSPDEKADDEEAAETPKTVTYEYVAVVYNGTRTFGGGAFSQSVVNCEIVTCRNASDLATCATLYNVSETLMMFYRFEELSVSGVFRHNDTMLMPSTLSPALLPLPTSMYEWKTVEHDENASNGVRYKNVSMELKNTDPILLSFGIFGRDFRNSANSMSSTNEIGLLIATTYVLSHFAEIVL